MIILTCLLLLIPFLAWGDEITLSAQSNGDIVVTADGKPFTTYILNSHNKPVLYPLIGPSGAAMTRQYPIESALPSEAKDHPHQRSVWLAHGDVNGLSYWDQEDSHPGKTIVCGHIVHQSIESCKGNTIVAKSNWVNAKGETDLQETRTMEFYAQEKARWIDFTFVLTAVQPRVKFGDTKEGVFAVRVAGTIKVDAKKGGTIVNSESLTNSNAWGKPASWVDYYGPVDNKTVGIALMNHPGSYGYPTCWHVRGYGLFAANPFGLHDFYGDKSGKNGEVVLKKGESITLKYRLLLHTGDEKQGGVEQSWQEYSK